MPDLRTSSTSYRGVFGLYREALAGIPRRVWLLSLVSFVNRSGCMVVPFLTLYLTGQRGYTPGEAGLVLMSFGIGGVLGVALGGFASDRVGFRAVMAFSLIATAPVMWSLTSIETHTGLLIGSGLFGFTQESFRPASSAAIAAYTGEGERRRAYGLYRLAINAGWSIGPALGGLLATYGYGLLFLVDGATSAAAGVLLLFSLKKLRPDEAPSEELKSHAADSNPGPLRDGPFLVFVLLSALQALIIFQIFSTYPLFLTEERGFSEPAVGLLLGLNTVLIVVLEMPLVRILERRGAVGLMSVAALFIALGFGLLPFAQGAVAVALLVVVYTIGEILSLPTSNAWVADRSSPENRGAYMSVFALSFSLAYVAAPAAGLWVHGHYGGDAVWFSCLVIGLVAALGMLGLKRMKGGA